MGAMMNYALVQQHINKHMYKAEKFYRRAIVMDPHDKCVQQNFLDFKKGNGGSILTAEEKRLAQIEKKFERKHQDEHALQAHKAKDAAEAAALMPESSAVEDLEGEHDPLTMLLHVTKLARFREKFEEMGVESVKDISYLDDEDLTEIGLKRVHLKKPKRE